MIKVRISYNTEAEVLEGRPERVKGVLRFVYVANDKKKNLVYDTFINGMKHTLYYSLKIENIFCNEITCGSGYIDFE